jgi:hypothetical protein
MNRIIKYHKYTAFKTEGQTIERLKEVLEFIFWEVACNQKLTPINYRLQIKDDFDENLMPVEIGVIDFLCVKQGKKKARDCYYNRSYPNAQFLQFGSMNVEVDSLPRIDLVAEIVKAYLDLKKN